MKILILEDEQRNAMRLIRLLNDIDTTFIIEGPLTNIKEAVDFFQSGKTTDLILADIRLTDGLSFEALKYAPATVPIIFTTAYDEYAVQAFKFNSFDYLLKPLDADELEAAIDKATKAGKNYADENLRQLFDSLQKNQFPVIGNVSCCPIVTDIRPYVFRTSTISKPKTRRYTFVLIMELQKLSICQWTNSNSNSILIASSVPTANT